MIWKWKECNVYRVHRKPEDWDGAGEESGGKTMQSLASVLDFILMADFEQEKLISWHSRKIQDNVLNDNYIGQREN